MQRYIKGVVKYNKKIGYGEGQVPNTEILSMVKALCFGPRPLRANCVYVFTYFKKRL